MNATDTPKMTFRFPEPSTARTLNHRGATWRTGWRASKQWRTAVAQHALTLGRSPSERRRPPCFVRVSFPVDTNRRRDPHNWAPAVKAIVDGMVDAGVWPDDNDQWVTVLDSRFHQVPRHTIGDVVVEMFPRAGALPE